MKPFVLFLTFVALLRAPAAVTNHITQANATNAVSFDLLMRGFMASEPEENYILIDAGTYHTTGNYEYNEDLGWLAVAGWRVIGAGMGATTIIYDSFPESANGNGHGVFFNRYTDPGDVLIQDLTIDLNWPNLDADEDNHLFAANLHGDNVTYRRVWSKNGYGNAANGNEGWDLAIGSRIDGMTWQDNTNALIEECVVTDYQGDYGVGISLLPGDAPYTNWAQGVVRNCRVTNFVGTAAFGISSLTILEGNITSGCRKAFYTEGAEDTIIRNNFAFASSHFVIHLNPIFPIRRVAIDGNYLESLESGISIAVSGSENAHASDIWLFGNTLTNSGPNAVDGVTASFCAGLSIFDNLVAIGMDSFVHNEGELNSDLLLYNNRNPTNGVPPGLEDFP